MIAKNLFERENNLIQLDMSEFSEKTSVSRLIGASPGYVGFEEGAQLIERVKRDNIEEVILACSNTVEGQTTAFYIQDSLKDTKAKITKLAQGLPVGGEIENLDDGTLFSAFKNRSKLNTNSD